jgi:hypothetical protein
MIARVQRPDGTLEGGVPVALDEEPAMGDYLTLADGRRVQVMGSASESSGRLAYLVVVEAPDPNA